MAKEVFKIAGGPLFAMIVYIVLPESYVSTAGSVVDLSQVARLVLACGGWMAWWWVFEAAPVAVTALLPIVLFPSFGAQSLRDVCSVYAHPLILLFFGGFLISIAVEKWALHQWIATRVLRLAKGDARHLVAGFMLVSASISMWLSNTATAIMMLPIALALIKTSAADGQQDALRNFPTCLLLGVAYGATIGGTATLIGSPPNLFVAGFLERELGISIGFSRWMQFALPLALILFPATWWALVRYMTPVSAGIVIRTEDTFAAPGWWQLPSGARRVGLVFIVTATAWVARPMLSGLEIAGVNPLMHISDTAIAIAAAISLFLLPAGADGERLMRWQDAERIPVGTLLLFGGGLALAGAIRASGADSFIGTQLSGGSGMPAWMVILGLIAGVVFLTELTSNTATTTALAPILAAGALAFGLPPAGVIVITALAASSAFMMPVATPPNAIIYGSGYVPMRDMIRAGFVINMLAISCLYGLSRWWLPGFAELN